MITFLRHLLSPLFGAVPLPLAYLILLTADISLLPFLIMPRYSCWMNFWLRPGPGHSWQAELARRGILLAVIGFTLSVPLIFGF